jgi:5-formyltetrahydrofolate cyclo-ligase
LKLREALNPNLSLSESKDILDKILNLNIYQKAKSIMFYMSCRQEVNTQDMINFALKDAKKVAIPAIIDKDKKIMKAFVISKLEEARQEIMGIRQPKIDAKNEIDAETLDLIFVPGVVFDKDCNRIGYGQGYFDRWLKNVKKNKVAGLAYDFQIIDKIPTEEFDESLGMIISGKRIINRKNKLKLD